MNLKWLQSLDRSCLACLNLLCTCGFVLLYLEKTWKMEMQSYCICAHKTHTQSADTDRSRVLTFLLLRRQ